MSSKAFRKIQISNAEDTPGTAEAAVEIVQGRITPLYAGDQWYDPTEEEIGLLSSFVGGQRLLLAKEAPLVFEGDLNMRHAVWQFCNAIRGNITATQPDATNQPNAYLWTIEPTLVSPGNTPDNANGIDTFTIEYGDDVQAYEAAYIFTRSLVISGGPREQVQVSWEITGDKVTETTFTGALTLVKPQRFPFELAKFYADTSYANIGNTQKTALLRSFEWRLDTQFSARFGPNGQYHFAGIDEGEKHVQLALTYYRGTDSEAAKALYDAASTTYLRIALEGATELDSGQSNVPYVYLDGAFEYAEWAEAGDEDNALVENVNLHSVYDGTGAKEYGVKILNDLSAYPA